MPCHDVGVREWRMLVAAIGVVGAFLLAGSPAVAGAATYTTVRVPNSNGFSEPRVSVDPAGHFWLESNASDNSAAIWGSTDGLTWKQTPTEPAGQTEASTDVDVVTTPSGRIVETELDLAALISVRRIRTTEAPLGRCRRGRPSQIPTGRGWLRTPRPEATRCTCSSTIWPRAPRRTTCTSRHLSTAVRASGRPCR